MIDVFSWVERERKLYFKAYTAVGGTYCYDIDNDNLTIISENLIEEKWKPNAYFRVCSIDNILVFPPYYSNDSSFFIYNIINEDKKYLKKEKSDVYRSCVAYKGKVYTFGKNIKDIAEINVDKYKIMYPFENVMEDVQMNTFSNVYICGCFAYVNIEKKDAILKINLDSYEYTIIEFPELDAVYGTIVYYNGYFYLTGDREWILKWDGYSFFEKIMLPINKNEMDSISWKQYFSDIIVMDGKIYMAPLYYRAVVLYDCSENKVKLIYDVEDGLITWGCTYYDDYICLPLVNIHGKMSKYVRINIKNNEILDDDIFDFDRFSDLNLCKYGEEYSKHALKKFLGIVRDSN